MKITVRYHGHSCFTLTADGYTLALDPYDPSVPGYPPLCLTAHKTICSHMHHDHSFVDAVCMPLNECPCPFKIEAIKCFHDDKQGSLRGENIIHIICAGGLRIAHFGDLGHMPDDTLLQKIGSLNMALVPVGGTYTIDSSQAHQLSKMLDTAVVVPMHYRKGNSGYDNIAHIDEYLRLCEDVRFYGGELVLSESTPRQTAVFEIWKG